MEHACDDLSMPPDYAPNQFWHLCETALQKVGKSALAIQSVDAKLKAAGFVNITRRVIKIPFGTWAKGEKQKKIGLMWRSRNLGVMADLGPGLLGRILGWSREEIEVYLVGVRKGMMDPRIHSYWNYHIVTAQKPYSTAPNLAS